MNRMGGWGGCLRWWLVTGLASALAACGGGGGGGGGTTPFADTAAAYWVAGTGAHWTYQLVDRRPGANSAPVLKTVTDAGEAVVGGQTVRRFEHSWSLFERAPETEHRRFDGREIRAAADLAAELGVPIAPLDYAEVPAPLVDGETRTLVDRRETTDIDGDGRADTIHMVLRATTARVAALSVPAGDLTDVLRVRQELVATVAIAGTSLSESATAAITTWYGRGIGVVRRVYEDPSVVGGDNTVTEELVGVAAGGQRAGLVTGLVALDGIGSGNDSGTPAATRVAVGGARVMALAIGASGSVEAAIHTIEGTPVWRGTVMSIAAPYRFADAAVAFDGSDFRVVATHTIPFNSPTEWALRAQRVRPDGSLRDGQEGVALDSGIADRTQTLAALHAAARDDGRLAVAWGRYDTALVEVSPGLVTSRGYVIEGRVFGADQQPVAPRFELGSGLPASMARRADQFIIVDTSQHGAVSALSSWAVGTGDGLPVSPVPRAISTTASLKDWARLHAVGDTLWVSYAEWTNLAGPPVPSIVVARLGLDGALLDGTPAAPGHTLFQPDAQRGLGLLGLGPERELLVWGGSVYGDLRTTVFDPTVLVGGSLPSASLSLVVGNPLGGMVGPSRVPIWAGPAGNAMLIAWLENEGSVTTPSDRVVYAWMYPPLTP